MIKVSGEARHQQEECGKMRSIMRLEIMLQDVCTNTGKSHKKTDIARKEQGHCECHILAYMRCERIREQVES